MAQDESTYGFSKTDATELVQLIGGGDREYTEGKVRSSGSSSGSIAKLAKTPVGGIGAMTGTGTGGDPYSFTYAVCTVIDPSTGLAKSPSETIDVGNTTTNDIPGSTLIQAKQIDGTYFVDVADCPPPP